MKRFVSLSLLALGLIAGVLAGFGIIHAADKPKSIKEVMKLVHNEDGIRDTISESLAKKPADWATVSTKSKEWVDAATDMTKGKPKKGSAESWKKLSTKWLNDAKALHTASEKKDLKAAQTALKSLGTSCKACHTAHKGK